MRYVRDSSMDPNLTAPMDPSNLRVSWQRTDRAQQPNVGWSCQAICESGLAAMVIVRLQLNCWL